jgi:N-acetylmuramoyl-L-alanine amidase
MESAGVRWLGRFGRNYAFLREARGIALVVEPLFLTSPEGEALAGRPEHVEKLARALAGGFADYIARIPLQTEEAS